MLVARIRESADQPGPAGCGDSICDDLRDLRAICNGAMESPSIRVIWRLRRQKPSWSSAVPGMGGGIRENPC
jgi:hypothetical protein